MTDTANIAAEGEQIEGVRLLLPAMYDITWSLIPFALLLFVFWKYVIPRYRKVLDERTEAIEGGIARAEEAQQEAKQALAQYREQLASAREEAAVIREEARTQGAQITADLKAKAEEESTRIIAAGEQQLAAQRQQVVSELRGDLGQMSVDLAEKLVGESLSDTAKQSSTIDRFLSEIDQAPAK